MYAGFDYLQQVWQYHQKMVDAICAGDHEAGYKALVEHKDLLYYRPVADLMGSNRTQTNQSETT
jgi:DNA-binding FadR family transcriptional regulator